MSSPKEFFEQRLAQKLKDEPDLAHKINAVYQFNIEGDSGGDWTVDLTEPEVRSGRAAHANCTVTVGDEDFMKIVGGQLNAQMAFMSGKLKIGGDLSLAMKLADLFK
ncbi:MAG: SCP2 sterol-binding domain-containing protein [Acidobacteriota bacterium]